MFTREAEVHLEWAWLLAIGRFFEMGGANTSTLKNTG